MTAPSGELQLFLAKHFPVPPEQPFYRSFIATEDGEIVSHVGLDFREILYGNARLVVGAIQYVCTAESHRGQGLANDLLFAAEGAAGRARRAVHRHPRVLREGGVAAGGESDSGWGWTRRDGHAPNDSGSPAAPRLGRSRSR